MKKLIKKIVQVDDFGAGCFALIICVAAPIIIFWFWSF